jgi:hypothetical protein
MEDVLDVYARPYNAQQPVVCLDEATKILHSPLRESVLPKSGQVKREDYSYRQHGSANIFVSVEPLAGKRKLYVTDHHAGSEIAEALRKLVEEDYPKAEKIILITDNLKSHKPHLLYETFPPEQARAIARKIEWHYTPEHASWLNIAEIELSAFSTQCLNQKIGDKTELQSLASVWANERNDRCVKVDWQFRTDAARIKLKRLYPTFESRET